MGYLASKEIAINGTAWRRNGGKIMRMINERIGEDSYRLRFEKVDSKVDEEMSRTILIFLDHDEAQIYRLIADREWHGK